MIASECIEKAVRRKTENALGSSPDTSHPVEHVDDVVCTPLAETLGLEVALLALGCFCCLLSVGLVARLVCGSAAISAEDVALSFNAAARGSELGANVDGPSHSSASHDVCVVVL